MKKNEKKTTKQKNSIIAFVSIFLNSNQQFENLIFIKSTSIFKTNLQRSSKQHIEQLFNATLSIENLIK